MPSGLTGFLAPLGSAPSSDRMRSTSAASAAWVRGQWQAGGVRGAGIAGARGATLVAVCDVAAGQQQLTGPHDLIAPLHCSLHCCTLHCCTPPDLAAPSWPLPLPFCWPSSHWAPLQRRQLPRPRPPWPPPWPSWPPSPPSWRPGVRVGRAAVAVTMWAATARTRVQHARRRCASCCCCTCIPCCDSSAAAHSAASQQCCPATAAATSARSTSTRAHLLGGLLRVQLLGLAIMLRRLLAAVAAAAALGLLLLFLVAACCCGRRPAGRLTAERHLACTREQQRGAAQGAGAVCGAAAACVHATQPRLRAASGQQAAARPCCLCLQLPAPACMPAHSPSTRLK